MSFGSKRQPVQKAGFSKAKDHFPCHRCTCGDNRKNNGKGEVYAKLIINILGKTQALLDKKSSGIKLGDKKSFFKEFGYTIRFVIVVVPVSVKVGASFETGIRWSLNVLATSQAEVTPFISSDAFARFAVDVFTEGALKVESRSSMLKPSSMQKRVSPGTAWQRLCLHRRRPRHFGAKGAISAFVKVNWCIFACSKTFGPRFLAGRASKELALLVGAQGLHHRRQTKSHSHSLRPVKAAGFG